MVNPNIRSEDDEDDKVYTDQAQAIEYNMKPNKWSPQNSKYSKNETQHFNKETRVAMSELEFPKWNPTWRNEEKAKHFFIIIDIDNKISKTSLD